MSKKDTASGLFSALNQWLRRFFSSELWKRRQEIVNFIFWLARLLNG